MVRSVSRESLRCTKMASKNAQLHRKCLMLMEASLSGQSGASARNQEFWASAARLAHANVTTRSLWAEVNLVSERDKRSSLVLMLNVSFLLKQLKSRMQS